MTEEETVKKRDAATAGLPSDHCVKRPAEGSDPASASIGLLTFPNEILSQIAILLSSNETLTFRTLCRRTRNLIDEDWRSPFWADTAERFFTAQFEVLTGAEQLALMASQPFIVRASKSIIHFCLDHTMTLKLIEQYDALFRSQQIRYGIRITVGELDGQSLNHLLGYRLAVENITVECHDFSRTRFPLSLSLCSNVKTLRINGNFQLEYESGFGGLEHLYLHHCSYFDHAVHFDNLRTLRLDPDRDIAWESVSALPTTLEELSLSVDLSAEVSLSRLTRLTCLHLRGNTHLPIGELDYTLLPASLRHLFLQDYEIDRLDGIAYLVNLERLECNSAELRSIRGLRELSKLESLTLSHAFLTAEELSHLPPTLIYLDLRGTNAVRLPYSASRLPHLKTLLLFDQRSEEDWEDPWGDRTLETPPSLTSLCIVLFCPVRYLQIPPHLTNLDVECDSMRSLRKVTFPRTLKRLRIFGRWLVSSKMQLPETLEVLDLSGSSLKCLRQLVLPPTLLKLNLYHNCLKELDCSNFPRSLRYLSAGRNLIQRVVGLDRLSALQVLHLPENFIPSLGALPPRLVNLDVSGNLFTDISRLILPSSLLSLSISENRILNVKGFICNEQLLRLHMRHCYIPNSSALQLNENLRVLDMTSSSPPGGPDLPQSLLRVRHSEPYLYGEPEHCQATMEEERVVSKNRIL